ncbi:(d)CMP kinase [Youxingia wuxianensis]|uniref:Cytidylate kinase n=1 Tax=Youxingia wuxianensis TaxID=2763678 RepID=A0A926ERE9_9FIRM|nr:(d)CMP kinase [Youxingia wuxianensis]MBC8584994.1 (d)CMP kinase [Youxingia wuxianensis]
MVSIAIDGPAGAGKSTIAKHLAKKFGYIYVDTGALYRAIGLYAYEKGKNTASEQEVVPLLEEIEVKLAFVQGEQRVFLGERDVSQAIRQPEISMAASNVSAIPKVREFLFDLQRDIAKQNNVVMDGRDIGTVVLPDAQVKIFLTATPQDRARRRYEELIQKGHKVDYDQLLEEVIQRDYNDSNRAIAPLRQAKDATLLDTTNFTLEQAVQAMTELVEGKLKDVL